MLKVSENKRYLVTESGEPFFYLGDTAWALLQRLTREETDLYLEDRAAKGFTTIQTVAISEFDGLTSPNRYGETPFVGLDPERPNEGYFAHVDYVVEKVGALGMYVALLPTWGDKVGPLQWGTGPEVFTPHTARSYGRFLGRRYRDSPIIWVVGGDRNPTAAQHSATWRALAEGLDEGDAGRHLMTFHPQGGSSSAEFFQDDAWLDFNMIQSGHSARDLPNYAMIARDYDRSPTKPCMDGEPCYEDHPVNWGSDNGYFSDYDTRKALYRALFAGAHGHTYGANGVFQFWTPQQEDRFGVRRPWQEAVALPGSAQMQHARGLLESRPFLGRIPDQSLLLSGEGDNARRSLATRADDGAYALVYSASGKPVTVDLRRISGDAAVAHWYDPREGTAWPAGRFPTGGECEFVPPSTGESNDWVLVLDDESRGFRVPGLVR